MGLFQISVPKEIVGHLGQNLWLEGQNCPKKSEEGRVHDLSISFSVEAAGGKALPCLVDIRDEEAVKSSVEQAVRKFGGIDILVNNASAISLTGTLETPMKR